MFHQNLTSERRHFRINRQLLYESTTNANRERDISALPQKRNSFSLRKTNSNSSRASHKRKNSVANSTHSNDQDDEFDDDTSTYRPSRHFRLSGASSSNPRHSVQSQHTTAVRNSPVSWQTQDQSTRRTSLTGSPPHVPTTAPTTADTARQPTAGSSTDKSISLPGSRDIRLVDRTMKGRHDNNNNNVGIPVLEQPEQVEQQQPQPEATPMEIDTDRLHVDTSAGMANVQDDIVSPALRNNTNRYSDSPAAARSIADKLDAASIDRRRELKVQRRLKRRKILKRISGMRCGSSSEDEGDDSESFNAGREIPANGNDPEAYDGDIFLVEETGSTNVDWRSRAKVKSALKRLSCRKDL